MKESAGQAPHPGHRSPSEEVILKAISGDDQACIDLHGHCAHCAALCRRRHPLTDDDAHDLAEDVFADLMNNRHHLLDQAVQNAITHHMAKGLKAKKPLGNTGVRTTHLIEDGEVVDVAHNVEAAHHLHDACEFYGLLYEKKMHLAHRRAKHAVEETFRHLMLLADSGELITRCVCGLIGTHLERHLSAMHAHRDRHVSLAPWHSVGHHPSHDGAIEARDFLFKLASVIEPALHHAFERLSQRDHDTLVQHYGLAPHVPLHGETAPHFRSRGAHRKALQRARRHLAAHLTATLQAERQHDHYHGDHELIDTAIRLVDRQHIVHVMEHIAQMLTEYRHAAQRAEDHAHAASE
ncbi:MAG: hypothetical protein WAW06_01090 [bacterium]